MKLTFETKEIVGNYKAVAGGSRNKQKQGMGGKQAGRVSQGGTKTVFMMPQIVNQVSNFLLLAHSSSEMNTGFIISHLPILQTELRLVK